MKYLKIFETFDRNDTLYVFDFDDTLVNTPEFEGFVIEYLTEDVSIKEIVDNNLTDMEAYELQLEYDKKYPELYHLPTKRLLRPGWRHDNKVSQVLSVRKSGIFFPIAYPNHRHGDIFKRGTHRALVFAALGYDVPIIVQHPELGGNPEAVFELTTANDEKEPYFSDIEYKFTVDLKNKKLTYE